MTTSVGDKIRPAADYPKPLFVYDLDAIHDISLCTYYTTCEFDDIVVFYNSLVCLYYLKTRVASR